MTTTKFDEKCAAMNPHHLNTPIKERVLLTIDVFFSRDKFLGQNRK